MATFDYEKICRELLTAMRGNLSQVQVNRKMKYRSNQIHRWETGTAKISWTEFCALAAGVGAPLEKSCVDFLSFSYAPTNFRKLIEHLSGSSKQAELASRAGVSRSMVSRWKAGKISPSLEQMLRLIEASTWCFPSFVSALANGKILSSLEEELRLQNRERELHYKYPWVGPLLLVFLSRSYLALPSHREGFAAAAIGISVEQERTALAELMEVGAIELVGKKYRPRIRRINVAGNAAGNKRIRAYWTARCQELLKLEKFPAPFSPGQWPYMVFSMSPEDFTKIRQKIMELYQEIETLAQKSKDADEIYLFNSQLFEIKHLPS